MSEDIPAGPDAAATFARNLFAALARLGVGHAVVSPGSRNAPLALAALRADGISCHTVLDERSAAFVALGSAKAEGMPAVLVCTSGTAGAHYAPAVIEAWHARVPLIVITADRPPELRGAGAPQTIDQTGLFGSAVKSFHDSGVPDAVTARGAADLAARVVAAARDLPSGPVHLNVPLREPLVGSAHGQPPDPPAYVQGVPALEPDALDALAAALEGRTVLVVAGGRQRAGFGAACALLETDIGVPIASDPQCRYPGPVTIATADLLATAGFVAANPPDVVLRLGPIPTSKPLWRWLESSGVPQVWVDDGPWRDPLGSASLVVRADPTSTMSALVGRLGRQPRAWTDAWVTADRLARSAVEHALERERFPTEPAIAAMLGRFAAAGSAVYAASSMPIRDVDTFMTSPRRDVIVLSNRGANGIDGTISAAAGAALDGRRTYALVGDVAALHDLGGLVTLAGHQLPVTVVVVNNDGGGIFHFLPHADPEIVDPAAFEAVFGTPHGRSLAPVAAALGIPSRVVDHEDDFEEAIAAPPAGPSLVEVHTDRTVNPDVHARLRAAVAAALS